MDDIPVWVFAGFPLHRDTAEMVVGKSIPDASKGTVFMYCVHTFSKLRASLGCVMQDQNHETLCTDEQCD